MATAAVNLTTTNPAAGAANGNSAASNGAPAGGLANENTFLQLLVAQLKNQDPQNPADGTQFVTQLAQFSSLEQQLGMKTDLDQIVTKLKTPPAPAAGSTTPAASTSPSTSTPTSTSAPSSTPAAPA